MYLSQRCTGDIHIKGKVFCGQEPPSGEYTITEYGVNYQLLAVITEVAQWRTPSCSRPQPATDKGVSDGRSNWVVAPPPTWAVPPELHVLQGVPRPTNRKTWCTNRDSNARPLVCQTNALPVLKLRVYNSLTDIYKIAIRLLTTLHERYQ